MTARLHIAALLAISFTALIGREAAAREDDVLRSPTTEQAAAHEFSPEDDKFLDLVERGCFNYLWREVGMPAELAKDRRTTLVASTAGVGFQLSSLPIGVERGWITREQGERRALKVLHSLMDRTDNRREGMSLHFVHADTGAIYPMYNNEAATVDHALLLAGALPAATYFGGEVAALVDRMAAETNWQHYVDEKSHFINFGFDLDDNADMQGDGHFYPSTWHVAGDEERIVYFVAVGCPTEEFAADLKDYYRLERHIGRDGDDLPFVMSPTGCLFTYFFSHCWINYRDLEADDPSQFGVDAPRVDWFENSRRAVLTHRRRCLAAADRFPTLGGERWGLSACMGFDRGGMNYLVPELRPSLFDRDEWQEGTVAPYAAGSSIMFAPTECLAALRAFAELKDDRGEPLVWRDPEVGGYAFADSYKLDPPRACDDNVAIDVGPMLLAIENARTGAVWKLFMEHPVARRAVERLKLQPREAK